MSETAPSEVSTDAPTLPWWDTAPAPLAGTALWLDGEPWQDWASLLADIERWRMRLASHPRCTVLVRSGRNHPSIVAPLCAALACDHVLMMSDARLPRTALAHLEAAYLPALIIEPSATGDIDLRETGHPPYPLHPELALLLSTSGSTGSPRFVKLSARAVRANARAIARSLDIGSADVAVAHLDVHYSYGWSVLASHLTCGAALSFSTAGFTERGFWTSVAGSGGTHFPGVPTHYEIMHRLGLARLDLPAVSTMTQAGGRLQARVRDPLHAFMDARGGRFVVMYGQTEAGPRMSALAHHDYAAHPDSVGRALPGGRFEIVGPDGRPAAVGESGEVVHSGPNVMFGYATGWRDLVDGDALGGRLPTGDRGRLDGAGFLFLEGRRSRTAKVHGLRINLDELEAHAGELGDYRVCRVGEALALVRADPTGEGLDEAERTALLAHMEGRFAVPRTVWRFRGVAAIPLGTRGKVDHRRLESLLDDAG